jgi:hypothetical protein
MESLSVGNRQNLRPDAGVIAPAQSLEKRSQGASVHGPDICHRAATDGGGFGLG